MSAISTMPKMRVLLLLSIAVGTLVFVSLGTLDQLTKSFEQQQEYYVPLDNEAFAALLDRIHDGYYERPDPKFENLLRRIHAGEFEFHDPRPNRK